MKPWFLLATALAAAPAAVHAESAMKGVGGQPCSRFNADHAANAAVNDAAYWTWAQGFLGGLNAVAVQHAQPIADLDGVSDDAQQKSVGAFCQDHPDSAYFMGVFTLYQSLPTAASPNAPAPARPPVRRRRK